MDPNSRSNLPWERAQGANTGDIRDFGGTKWRWQGEKWEQEPGYNQPTTSSAYQTDYARIAREQLQMQREANQPAITSLQSQIPTIQKSTAQQKSFYEGEKEPLKQRYSAILDELTRREKVQTESATLRTAREYSRRGIPLSSDVYARGLEEETKPISEYYTGQVKETGLAQETDLREIANRIAALPIAEEEKMGQIQQAIAALESGASKDAIQQALGLYQTGVGQQQSQAQLAQALRIAEMEKESREAGYKTTSQNEEAKTALARREFEEYKLPYLKYLINKPYYKTEGGGDEENELNEIFRGSGIPSYFTPIG